MKPCVKFKSVCKIDIGVIAPYLILFFFSFNQYVSKNSYLKTLTLKYCVNIYIAYLLKCLHWLGQKKSWKSVKAQKYGRWNVITYYCFLLIETKSNLLQLFLIKAVYFLEENFFFQLITYMEKEHLPHVIYICFFENIIITFYL